MANPFLQFTRNPPPDQPDQAPPPAAAPTAQPPAVGDNPFLSLVAPPATTPAATEMDNWWTKGRKGERIQFQAPKGADTKTVRAAAAAAGVTDVNNRSLQFGEPPADSGPTADQNMNRYGPVGTMIHNGVDFVAPVVDEIASGASAILGNGNYGDNLRYLQERAKNSAVADPGADYTGKSLAFAGTLPLAAGAKVLQGASKVGTAIRGGAFMGPYAAANAYFNNPVDDRWNGVPMAAALGTGLGAAAPLLLEGGAGLVNRLNQRLGISDAFRRLVLRQPAAASADQAAVDVLAHRVPQDVAAMRARAQEMRDAGHDPTLTNVVDEAGRGVIGAMARKATPGREIAQQAYDARRLSMPERIDRNMRTAVEADAADAATAAALNKPLPDVIDTIKAQRGEAMQAAMEPIRDTPVPLNSRMLEILGTADGQRAIGQAMRTVTDKPTLDAMRNLQTFVRGIDKNIPANLPPAAREQIVNQLLAKQGMTVDIADRISRKFNAMADTAPADTQAALRSFGQEVRTHARTTVPAYDQALQQYAEKSKSLQAIDTGGDFLKPNAADEFADRANKLNSAPAVTEVRPTTLSANAIKAVKMHTAGDEYLADAVDTYLRNPAKFTKLHGVTRQTVEDYISGLHEANAVGGPVPNTLYRGMVATDPTDVEKALQSGEWNFGKHTSYTSDPKIAGDYAATEAYATGDPSLDAGLRPLRFEISGAKGFHADPISGDPLSEYILPPGKIKITGHEVGPDGVTVIRGTHEPVANPAISTTLGPSDRNLAQAAARRAVQKAAGENISNAPGVARKIAVSPEQAIRTNALFAPLTAENLQKAMAISEQDLKHFGQIAPNTGSATAIREGDNEVAGHVLGAAAHLATGGGKLAAARMLMRSIGVRDQDAERIVRMAVDPARTDELINQLEKSYGKKVAGKIGTAFGLTATQQTSRTLGGSR